MHAAQRQTNTKNNLQQNIQFQESNVPRYHVRVPPKETPPLAQQRLRVNLLGLEEDIIKQKKKTLLSGAMSGVGEGLLKGAGSVFGSMRKMSGLTTTEEAVAATATSDSDSTPTKSQSEPPEQNQNLPKPPPIPTNLNAEVLWRGSKVALFTAIEKVRDPQSGLTLKRVPNAGESVLLPLPLTSAAKKLSSLSLVVREGGGGGADGGRMKTGKFVGELVCGWNNLSVLKVFKEGFMMSKYEETCNGQEAGKTFKSTLLDPLPVTTGGGNKSYRILAGKRMVFTASVEETKRVETHVPVSDVCATSVISRINISVSR